MFQRVQLQQNYQRHFLYTVVVAGMGIKKMRPSLPLHIIRRKLGPLFGAKNQLCREEHELSY
jgi:hypothetical protein